MTKSKKPKLNIRLLRRIQKHILEEPRRLKMRFWVDRKNTERAEATIPPCGTTACIAGWALLLSGIKTRGGSDTQARAAALLGIDDECKADNLFQIDAWPGRFAATYNTDIERPDFPYIIDHPERASIDSLQRNAKITVARIEHFIKTGK